MNDSKISIIGGGNMGLALAQGLAKSNLYKSKQITITRKNIEPIRHLENDGFNISNDNINAADNSNIIILGVLPKQIEGILLDIEPVLREDHIIISLATGINISDIKNIIKKDCAVARAMPNTAIAIGKSITCISYSETALIKKEAIQTIFNSVGTVQEIHEDLMSAAMIISSSSIAFFMRFIRAAMQGGVEIGLNPEQALEMITEASKGAAYLLMSSKKSHPELEVDKVTSPNGCTIAGLNEMEYNGFSAAFIKGIRAAFSKAELLHNEK